ncbi:hypothetical protein KBC04_05685 [Candidatus Babeliales bacterium]|nr:hypothetical protein [Candidatus Babeliales bacterium]MBP9844224.1 hypothetical protein [Candidatus Babeliales bacterium]
MRFGALLYAGILWMGGIDETTKPHSCESFHQKIDTIRIAEKITNHQDPVYTRKIETWNNVTHILDCGNKIEKPELFDSRLCEPIFI